jgi:O-antigen/teichoic acid export membrane protein
MSEIRATHAGLISFLGGLIGLVTGSIFSLIITRVLTPEEYGHWGLILSVVSYFPLILSVISYWSTRETATNLFSGKTAFLSTLGLSLIASIFFIIISYFITGETKTELNNFLLATILIPIMFLVGIFSSIAYGYKPHVLGISTVFYGISQVFSVLTFVYYFDLGIPGVILSLTLSYSVSTLILFLYVREKIKTSLQINFIKKWIKLSWIPLYPIISLVLANSTILIFVIITDSVLGIAYWTASLILVSIISSSGLISQATYSKLLKDKDRSFFQDNLTYLFYFAILFTALIITFARPGLFLLNPFYEEAFPIVIILSVEGFLLVLINMFQNSLIGIEKVDTNSNSTFKDYIKSKLFYVQSLRLIQVASYVVIFIVVFTLFTSSKNSLIELLIYWASISFVTHIPLFIIFFVLIKKNFSNSFDFNRITKFLMIGSIISIFSYFLTENFLLYDENIFQFAPRLLLFVGLVIGIYAIVTYLTDSKIKSLFNSIISEIIMMIRK